MKFGLFLILCVCAIEGFRTKRQAINDKSCLVNDGVCVLYSRCTSGKVVSDGFGVLTIESGTEIHQHSDCPLLLHVCCQDPDSTVNEPLLGGFVDPQEIVQPKCGQRNIKGVVAHIGRLNEKFSQFAEFPWMSAVLKIETSDVGKVSRGYLCGGSLIAPNIILTAAHCVFNFIPENIIVRAGEWDTQQTYEPFKHQERGASKIIQHPSYDPDNRHANDYSLIILKEPFALFPNVAPICLPDVGDSFTGQTCYASGWGKDKFGKHGINQNILKKVELEIVSHPKCEEALRTTRLGNRFNLHSNFTCAGGKPGEDTCGGDGGSPLVCRKDLPDGPSYVQAGIVAWGIGCGENGIPGVYADVRKSVEWINREIAPFKL